MALSSEKMNTMLLSLPCGYSGSLRSIGSNNSSVISYLGEVHSNPTFESAEHSDDSSSERHEYESIANRTNAGPRRKTNLLYEEMRPSPTLPLRSKHTTESDRSSRGSSTSSADSVPKKGDTPISKTALYTLLLTILAISLAALALVVLIIAGPLKPKCVCTESGSTSPPLTEMGSVSVQNLLRTIQDLEKSVKSLKDMKTEMEDRQNATNSRVTKLENQVGSLQKQVSKQAKLLNNTANKIAFVDGSAEQKLDTKIKNLNNELTSKVNELRQNHSQAKIISNLLKANVVQLNSSVLELKAFSGNVSTRTGNLEQRYAQVSTVIKTLTEVNEAQNSTHEALRLYLTTLKNSIVTVNATLNKEKLGSACEHNLITGTRVSTRGAGVDASVSYNQRSRPGYQVVGIACSTDYAQEFKLNSPQKGLYVCTCRGIAHSAATINPSVIHCKMHVWECPIRR